MKPTKSKYWATHKRTYTTRKIFSIKKTPKNNDLDLSDQTSFLEKIVMIFFHTFNICCFCCEIYFIAHIRMSM